ncbi:4Fe-4S single cluster domain-containing protein [Modestobacter italicus]|uniref:4Fe-4S single cluster domain-containing protein n=1 Tax=Modestobacter italicus (strain DSM 44449 / CECT 9708 / BC 501) TaxID=2732864 RepID=UPI0009FDB1A3|nr:4Fe-4S single cluster domain-containing protein [Modestobacter marinus]
MTGLRLARVLFGTTAEGPGLRCAVWVQGCSIRCSGCINPHLFTSRGGEVHDPVELVNLAVTRGCEGLTILGGEPFDQAEGCAELAEAGQRAGLGVITFSGYELKELKARGAGSHRLIEATDLLVDGPYRAHQPEEKRGLVGSSNQRFLHLTDRYAQFDPYRHVNRVDVRISATGQAEVAGFLDGQEVRQLMQLLDARRTTRSATNFPISAGSDSQTEGVACQE